jgi:hypothetical protein
MANVFGKKLHVEMSSWLGHDFSDNGEYHLNLYLDFQGKQAYRFERKSSLKHLVPTGFVENSYYDPTVFPIVTSNRFQVRLRAIERDGPFDPDDRAAGTIEIDLDRHPPQSSWSIIAAAPGTDLKMQVWFKILTLEYVNFNDGQPTGAIYDSSNWPFPWSDIRLFQHHLGLGQNVSVPQRPGNIISERVFWNWSFPNGPARKSIQRVYRYEVTELGLPHDVVSSIFLPRQSTVILHEHGPRDSRFDPAKGKRIGTFGLHNLGDIGWNDKLSTIDLLTTSYEAPPVN